ncbi:MAG: lipoprotein-releasing system ATP-binding protein [Polaribacter sp.]|jgi:lipoprotein-releasing system ATP-binding protein
MSKSMKQEQNQVNDCNGIILSATNIHKTFVDGERRVSVLKGVSLDVEKGDMLAILGTSGSGKSSLLHIFGGLDTPDENSLGESRVLIDGINIHKISIKKQGELRNSKLGFVYQFHHLLVEFSALENVCIPLIIGGMSVKKARERATEIITKVGLKDRMTHTPAELSGGERQRIAIARAMVTRPSCILADEPTGNLDTETASHIKDLMFELNRDEETSFLIVSHDLALAKTMHKQYKLVNGQLENLV